MRTKQFFLSILSAMLCFLLLIPIAAHAATGVKVKSRVPLQVLDVYTATSDPTTQDNSQIRELYNRINDPTVINKMQFILGKNQNPILYTLLVQNNNDSDYTYFLSIQTDFGFGAVLVRDDNEFACVSYAALEREKLVKGSYYPTIPLHINKQSTDTVYIIFNAIGAANSTVGLIQLLDENEARNQKALVLYRNAFICNLLIAFLALMFFQLIYISIQWYVNKDKEYQDYLLYIIFVLLYFILKAEIIFSSHIISSFIKSFFQYVNNLLLFVPYIFYLRFARHFLDMKEKYAHLNSQIKKVEWLILLLAIVYVGVDLFSTEEYSRVLLLSGTIAIFIYTLYLFIFFIRKRNKLINFFLIGSLFAATGHFLAMSSSAIPGEYLLTSFPPIGYTMVGLSLELLFFNNGLGYKAKYNQNEKLKAQQLFINELRNNEALKQKFQSTRDQLSKDLHDDLGASLSSIRIYSRLANDSLGKDIDQSRKLIQYINQTSGQIMDYMSDIVWSINPSNDTMKGLIYRLRNYASEVLSIQDISFHIDAPDHFLESLLPLDLKNDIYLIVKESINNQAKYSQATKSEISFNLENEIIEISIADNGMGFNPEKVSQGNGLKNFRLRVAKHEGTFHLDSTPGKGTRIYIKIPVNKEV